jgi:hypothetical protein
VVKPVLDGREKLSTAIHEVVISICEKKIIFFLQKDFDFYKRLKKYVC